MNLFKVSQTVKAWAAAVATGAGTLSGELVSGAPLGVGQWVTVALAFLGGLGIVYSVPKNAEPVAAAAPAPTTLP